MTIRKVAESIDVPKHMTIPTQAQIEAAVTAYYRRQGDTIESRMAAALAAAAEVGEKPFGAGYTKGYSDGLKYAEAERVALTAAADVPDQEHILQKPGQKPSLLPNGNTAAEVGGPYKDRDPLVTELIWEGCAQVVKEWFEAGGIEDSEAANAIITRIRALKDKP